jgi:integrase
MALRIPALQQAFDNWLAHQRVAGRLRRGSSEAVYRAMWQALVAWCLAQRPALRLVDLQGAPLLHYLASRSGQQAADAVLTPRYQQRLVSLVQRVRAHQVWQQQQASAGPMQALAMAHGATPAGGGRQPLLQPATGSDNPEPPLHLLPGQAAQLQALLLRTADDTQGRWQRLRDRCAVALQLGAGLGPGDVRALRLTDVRPAASAAAVGAVAKTSADAMPAEDAPTRLQLHVAANGSAPAHSAPLADWAASVLARWLAVRQAQALGGPWLLPSTRSGKPWGKVAQYESARRVLADAGLDPDGGGSFRLRHSFAMRQLAHGHDPGQVASWLGVIDPQVMLRYQRSLPPGTPVPASPDTAAKSASAALLLQATSPQWPV